MARRNKIKVKGAFAIKLSKWISDLNYFLDTKAGIALLIVCACIPEMLSTNNLFKEFFNQRGTNHIMVSVCVVGVIYFGGSYYLAVAGSKFNSIAFTITGVVLAGLGWYLTLADEYIDLNLANEEGMKETKFYIKVASITLFVIANGYFIGILCDKMCLRSKTDVAQRVAEEGKLNVALSSVRSVNATSYTNVLKGKSTGSQISEEEAKTNTKQQNGNRKPTPRQQPSTQGQQKPQIGNTVLTDDTEQLFKDLGI